MLTFKRTYISSDTGPWSINEYGAFEGDQHIGSIMLDPQAPQGRQWFWTITARVPQNLADRGYAATREQAMEDFKRQWAKLGSRCPSKHNGPA
jgi:hypothetical protein